MNILVDASKHYVTRAYQLFLSSAAEPGELVHLSATFTTHGD